MTVDTNPFRALSADINEHEFEIFCADTLKAYAKQENLTDFTVEPNQHLKTHDGTYQIDVFVKFTALRIKHTMLVECKKQGRKVERKVATDLSKKIESIGANKGLIISTSGFQSGTVQFAKAHGISLWQIVDNQVIGVVDSGHQMSPAEMQFQLQVEKYLPRYVMMEWDCDVDYPLKRIYPTREMYQNAIEKAKENYSD